jgi:hypothetical protein
MLHSKTFLSLRSLMQPDYPHKIFADKRMVYCLLMETLAIDNQPMC